MWVHVYIQYRAWTEEKQLITYMIDDEPSPLNASCLGELEEINLSF